MSRLSLCPDCRVYELPWYYCSSILTCDTLALPPKASVARRVERGLGERRKGASSGRDLEGRRQDEEARGVRGRMRALAAWG